MKIERQTGGIRISLSDDEAQLLRRALERASFIDTPVAEQGGIQEFCARALEKLELELPARPR